MFGLDNKSGINVMPPIAPADSQAPLWFTEGGAGLSATYPGQDWFNQIQAELLNVLKEAGLPADKSKLNQLALAVKAIAAKSAVPVVNSPGTSTTSVMSQKAVTDLAATKLDKTGGTINGRLNINSTWNILGVNASGKEGAYISFGENGGSINTAQIGFASEDSKFFRISNEKTGTVLHILNGYAQIDGKKVLTVDDTNSIVPVGATIIWNSSAPYPDNFWPNEGRSFSAADYPELAKIFPNLKLPDDRGYAIRAADNGKGIDSGRVVGTYQEDAGRRLEGKFSLRGSNGSNGETAFFGSGVFSPIKVGDGALGGTWVNPTEQPTKPAYGDGQRVIFDSDNVYPSANQFRMKNVAKILITRVK